MKILFCIDPETSFPHIYGHEIFEPGLCVKMPDKCHALVTII